MATPLTSTPKKNKPSPEGPSTLVSSARDKLSQIVTKVVNDINAGQYCNISGEKEKGRQQIDRAKDFLQKELNILHATLSTAAFRVSDIEKKADKHVESVNSFLSQLWKLLCPQSVGHGPISERFSYKSRGLFTSLT
jgi:hypothetical protein